MSAPRGRPSALIVLALEECPRVLVDAATEEELLRLRVWLDSSGYLERLVELAFEIADEGQAG